ncbi:MAG: flagellar biosynthesis protein FlhF [Lachnospiraceae bacterium]|nr:flagellar biosynthesis protein FlhF [Lachnospiraceae bacterium]
MIIKKFVGKTEEEATLAAKKELGETLVIMNVRKVKAKGPFAFLKAKRVEVTAAVEDEEEPLKQIRRIAQAQVAAQERIQARKDAERAAAVEAESGKKTQSAKTPEQIVAEAGRRTGLAPESSVGSRIDLRAADTGFAESARSIESSRNIERKLDSLQTLLENQFGKEERESREEEPKAPDLGQEGERSILSDQLTEEEREVDRFLKLLYNTMLDNEVDERIANELIQDVSRAKVAHGGIDHLLSVVYQRMILKFGKAEGILPCSGKSHVIFFIGPTGVGKTTTIAKIASSFSITGKKIALLTTDTYRIAATDQLRTYAGILGVPFRVIYTEEELSIAIEDFKDCEYIFVDTAGHSHKNEEFLGKQKNFFSALPEETPTQSFLVMSATTKYKDLKKIVDNYREISDFQLIFTKLDETSSLGNLLNMRLYSGAPIAYITTGQNVPDDIELFNAQKMVKQLLGGVESEN